MDYKVIAKNVRLSPRKARGVASVVKKLPLSQVLDKLHYLTKAAALPLRKALNSAIANSKLTADQLKIKNIFVDEGRKMKRRDTSHRFGRDSGVIQKRSSHITVILTNG